MQRFRDAGVPIELSIEGEPRAVDASVDLSAYRIVQEALTNVLKHAGPSQAVVRLRYSGGCLEIDVTDTGRGVLAAAGSGHTGHGLVGMRERAALVGGTLEASPGADRGFHVRARLPLRSDE